MLKAFSYDLSIYDKENYKHKSVLNRALIDLPPEQKIEENLIDLKEFIYGEGYKYLINNTKLNFKSTRSDLYVAAVIALGTSLYDGRYLISSKEALEMQRFLDKISLERRIDIFSLVSNFQQNNHVIAALNIAFYKLVRALTNQDQEDFRSQKANVEFRLDESLRNRFVLGREGVIYCRKVDFNKPVQERFTLEEGSKDKLYLYKPQFNFSDLVSYALAITDSKFAWKEPVKTKSVILPELDVLSRQWFNQIFEELGLPENIDLEQESQIPELIGDKVSSYLSAKKFNLADLKSFMQQKIYESAIAESEVLAFVRVGKVAAEKVEFVDAKLESDCNSWESKNVLDKLENIAVLYEKNKKTYGESQHTLIKTGQILGSIYATEKILFSLKNETKSNLQTNKYILLAKQIIKAGYATV